LIDVTNTLVLIRGGGDLASGVALRLFHSGFPVVITELSQPLMVRRTVSFGEAVYQGQTQVEDVTAVLVDDVQTARQIACAQGADRRIPVLIDADAHCRLMLHPDILIDAIIAKHNLGTTKNDAPLVIALGPGFRAGVDCHVVIETNRGHNLGRPLYQGTAEPDTGVPGSINGKTNERLLRAPVAGIIENRAPIGDRVVVGQVVAVIEGQEIRAEIDGVLRGLIRSGVWVSAHCKIGDVDPRAEPDHCYLVSDKSLAIGGGVLEAMMVFLTGMKTF
jgi:xanthine dehydrogenase accessory factor